jgi:hypothetical protein
MGDEHSDLKKPRWQSFLGALSGIFIGQCVGQYIRHRHAFHDQGFSAFQWDRFFLSAFGAFSAIFGVWLVGRNSDITTLGIGEFTAKKLR